MINLGIWRDLIVRTIELQFNHWILPKDVSNIKSWMQWETLSNWKVMEAILESCRTDGVKTSYKNDYEGQLTHIAFRNLSSIDIWKQYPDIMILDCTYQMNKYGLLALNIVGVMNQNTSFQIAIMIMKKETEIDFNWALWTLLQWQTDDAIACPRVIITDRALACSNALQTAYPGISIVSWIEPKKKKENEQTTTDIRWAVTL